MKTCQRHPQEVEASQVAVEHFFVRCGFRGDLNLALVNDALQDMPLRDLV